MVGKKHLGCSYKGLPAWERFSDANIQHFFGIDAIISAKKKSSRNVLPLFFIVASTKLSSNRGLAEACVQIRDTEVCRIVHVRNSVIRGVVAGPHLEYKFVYGT